MRRSRIFLSIALCAAAGAALALATGAAPAGAAYKHVIRGAGFGHGVGLSQYGALGFARRGRSASAILRHYYRGTKVERAKTRTIRVLLQSGRGQIGFRGVARAPGRRLNRGRVYIAKRARDGRVKLMTSGGKTLGAYRPPLRVSARDGEALRLFGTAINGISNGRYRGGLEVRPASGGGVMAVNALALDDYVRGVISGEMPVSWPLNALKAQATIARSYALATRKSGLFDHYPDTRSQVYRGVSGEHPRANLAVSSTKERVVTHRGKVASTYYFSTSGGRTENVENVWYGKPVPYLKSVDDPYDSVSPRHRWRLSFTTRQMEAKLGSLVKGRFRRIRVVKRGVSPRVVWADVVGTRGSTRVRGATLRARLGLFDTWMSHRRVDVSRSSRADIFGPLEPPRLDEGP